MHERLQSDVAFQLVEKTVLAAPMSMPILSLFDTDFYKITMGQVVFNQFPQSRARYQFINRGGTIFPANFGDKLVSSIRELAMIHATPEEISWLRCRLPLLKPAYLEWLANYHFDPDEVRVRQEQGRLKIEIEGPWVRTIYWEVPILALASELYFAGSQLAEDWEERIVIKARKMVAADVRWADFGTRRRFSYAIQDKVNEVMGKYRRHYLGTSNMHLAMKYDLAPIGTYAHEAPMAMQALVGTAVADEYWINAWLKEYRGELAIALSDTLTTPYFLRAFGLEYAKIFDGVRQDSGDPIVVAEMIIRHYETLNINPTSKLIIFSDNLTDDKLIALDRLFNERIKVIGGIGTSLTNDVGHRPLNVVIKMSEADFGKGFVPVVKLSDDPGKSTGDPGQVNAVMTKLGIPLPTFPA